MPHHLRGGGASSALIPGWVHALRMRALGLVTRVHFSLCTSDSQCKPLELGHSGVMQQQSAVKITLAVQNCLAFIIQDQPFNLISGRPTPIE